MALETWWDIDAWLVTEQVDFHNDAHTYATGWRLNLDKVVEQMREAAQKLAVAGIKNARLAEDIADAVVPDEYDFDVM